MVHKYAKDENQNEIWLPVTSPFGVPFRLRYIEKAEAYGLRVVVQGMDGRPRLIDFERGALARMNNSELRAKLFAAGLRSEDDGEHVAVKCLKAADPASEMDDVEVEDRLPVRLDRLAAEVDQAVGAIQELLHLADVGDVRLDEGLAVLEVVDALDVTQDEPVDPAAEERSGHGADSAGGSPAAGGKEAVEDGEREVGRIVIALPWRRCYRC